MPLEPTVSALSDNGTPFAVALPEQAPIVMLYADIAKKLDEEVWRDFGHRVVQPGRHAKAGDRRCLLQSKRGTCHN